MYAMCMCISTWLCTKSQENLHTMQTQHIQALTSKVPKYCQCTQKGLSMCILRSSCKFMRCWIHPCSCLCLECRYLFDLAHTQPNSPTVSHLSPHENTRTHTHVMYELFCIHCRRQLVVRCWERLRWVQTVCLLYSACWAPWEYVYGMHRRRLQGSSLRTQLPFKQFGDVNILYISR